MKPTENREMTCDARALHARIEERLRATSPRITWAKLCEKTEISARTFRRWSKGQNRPQRGTVELVAKTLGIPCEVLVEGLAAPCLDDPPPSSGGDPWFFHTRPADVETFVGRKALLDALRDAMEKGQGVNLVGDVGIGKTSLLKRWAAQATALRRHVVSVSSRDVELTPRALVQAITQQVDVPEDPDGAADALRQWSFRKGRIQKPLILIDAFDAFATKIDVRFFERLRQMIEEATLIVVLASERHVGELTTPGGTSPLAPVLQTLRVGLLDDDDAARLVDHASEVLDPVGRERIRTECGGHPLFIKLLAGHLLAERRDGGSIGDAVDLFRLDASRLLGRWWKRLGPREQQALRDVVGGQQPEQKLLNALYRRGLLTRAGQPFGDVLEHWFREVSCDPTP